MSDGLDRREFLQRGTLAAVAALLAGACGDGVIGNGGLTGPNNVNGFTIRLADYPSLGTVGGRALVNGAPVRMAVVRSGDAAYQVFSLICPHQGSIVGFSGSGFRCPNHGALWNAAGGWVGGQRTTNLVQLQVAYDAVAGTLVVSGNAGGTGGDDDDDP